MRITRRDIPSHVDIGRFPAFVRTSSLGALTGGKREAAFLLGRALKVRQLMPRDARHLRDAMPLAICLLRCFGFREFGV
jgi:hypothetical protein